MTLPLRRNRAGVELSMDAAFARRIRRLSVVSVGALGVITFLAAATGVHRIAIVLLAAGWILMPSLLVASLWHPKARYLLAVPAALVGTGLLVLCLTALPEPIPTRLGWLLITGGVWLGAVLGSWLWYRWLPVPHGLDDPFGAGRWTLAAIHVGMISSGILLVVL